MCELQCIDDGTKQAGHGLCGSDHAFLPLASSANVSHTGADLIATIRAAITSQSGERVVRRNCFCADYSVDDNSVTTLE